MKEIVEQFIAHVQELAKLEAEGATKEDQIKQYVNDRAVATHFGISTQSVARGRKKGEIPFHRIGGRILYVISEIEDSIKK